MKIALKVLVVMVLLGVGLAALAPVALSRYDDATKRKVLAEVARELHRDSGITEINKFMQTHTERYTFDKDGVFEFGGFRRQSNLDKMLFDRKVEITVFVDRRTSMFGGARVDVYYTFL